MFEEKCRVAIKAKSLVISDGVQTFFNLLVYDMHGQVCSIMHSSWRGEALDVEWPARGWGADRRSSK